MIFYKKVKLWGASCIRRQQLTMMGPQSSLLFLAVGLVATTGVASKDPLLGINLASGASATVNIGTDLLPGLTSNANVFVGLCGRSTCCVVRLSGYYNGHPGRVDTILSDYNSLFSPSYWSYVQQETDNTKLSYWLPENDTAVLTVSNNHQTFKVQMADGLFGRSSRSVTVQCRPDETQLLVQSAGVGSHQIFNREAEPKQLRGPMLTSGDQVTLSVRVPASGYSASLYVGLCTDHECATVVISTPSSAGSGNLAFGSGITVSNNPTDDFSVTYQSTPGREAWSSSEYDFSVALHPDGLLQVWMRTDTVAQVPLPDGWSGLSQGLVLKAQHSYGTLSYSREVSGTKSRSELPAPRFPAPISFSAKQRRTDFAAPSAVEPSFLSK
ncbi:uncharacterized protein LOC113213753 isoform X2 [Frankliniella occidentalis]|uniref:Uncharacterized protein LOC113213753 isoform X2 n=1 Tax=Frankliniella occidentalis TaxID=133901 RepID=A0A6J1TCX9_FRAOC|nr:uncharacterized protein LOC113213753 isoform X2 [Frankliniella occidentalis]